MCYAKLKKNLPGAVLLWYGRLWGRLLFVTRFLPLDNKVYTYSKDTRIEHSTTYHGVAITFYRVRDTVGAAVSFPTLDDASLFVCRCESERRTDAGSPRPERCLQTASCCQGKYSTYFIPFVRQKFIFNNIRTVANNQSAMENSGVCLML